MQICFLAFLNFVDNNEKLLAYWMHMDTIDNIDIYKHKITREYLLINRDCNKCTDKHGNILNDIQQNEKLKRLEYLYNEYE